MLTKINLYARPRTIPSEAERREIESQLQDVLRSIFNLNCEDLMIFTNQKGIEAQTLATKLTILAKMIQIRRIEYLTMTEILEHMRVTKPSNNSFNEFQFRP